jgi:hypothetical protein
MKMLEPRGLARLLPPELCPPPGALRELALRSAYLAAPRTSRWATSTCSSPSWTRTTRGRSSRALSRRGWLARVLGLARGALRAPAPPPEPPGVPKGARRRPNSRARKRGPRTPSSKAALRGHQHPTSPGGLPDACSRANVPISVAWTSCLGSGNSMSMRAPSQVCEPAVRIRFCNQVRPAVRFLLT